MLWILLGKYDQLGAYFYDVFNTKQKIIDASPNEHVGRKYIEDIWYEIEFYEICKIMDIE